MPLCPGAQEAEDIAAELGVGAATSDLELDVLKDVAEAQILDPEHLIGRFGALITCLCHNRCVCALTPCRRSVLCSHVQGYRVVTVRRWLVSCWQARLPHADRPLQWAMSFKSMHLSMRSCVKFCIICPGFWQCT